MESFTIDKSPLVSVILPTYNGATTLLQAVYSICAQTFKDWELVIVDDASTDSTLEILNGIEDKRIKIISQERNAGYPAGMNVGIAIAVGKFIARMDADDVSEPNRLEEQLKALEKYPHAAFCGVARYRITPGGKMYVDKESPKEYYREETWKDLMDGRRIFTDPSVMIAKEKVAAAGGYRTFQRSGMDVDLWLRVMERYGPCITITTPLFGKRLEPGSIIFNPQTPVLNQVPRLLALQRKERGKDLAEEGLSMDMEEFKQKGWIKTGGTQNEIGLFHGAITTCLWFGDWKGALIYARQLRKNTSGQLPLLKMVMAVMKKLVQRVWNNPYVRFKRKA